MRRWHLTLILALLAAAGVAIAGTLSATPQPPTERAGPTPVAHELHVVPEPTLAPPIAEIAEPLPPPKPIPVPVVLPPDPPEPSRDPCPRCGRG